MNKGALFAAAVCNAVAAGFLPVEPLPLALNFTVAAILGWGIGRTA